MKILGIDQSSKKVGFALFEGGVLVDSGHEELLPVDDFYGKFMHMEYFMQDVLEKYTPDIVFTEDPMSLARVNPKVCQILMLTLSAMVYTCGNRDIQMEILAPTQIKKIFTGKGNAKKDVVRSAVQEKFGFLPDSEDEADAIAIAFTGLSKL